MLQFGFNQFCLFVPQNIVDIINDTNKKLFDIFGNYFLNVHKEFTAENGLIKKDLFRRDGLHL